MTHIDLARQNLDSAEILYSHGRLKDSAFHSAICISNILRHSIDQSTCTYSDKATVSDLLHLVVASELSCKLPTDVLQGYQYTMDMLVSKSQTDQFFEVNTSTAFILLEVCQECLKR